jgi:hypothetical protein
MVEAMLEGEIEELLRRALERAKNGDSRLSRFFLAPFVSKDRRIQIDLPRLETAEDAPKAVAAVLRAIAEGEITPGEGALLTAQIAQFAQSVDAADLSRRLEAIEATIMSEADMRAAIRNSFPGSPSPKQGEREG